MFSSEGKLSIHQIGCFGFLGFFLKVKCLISINPSKMTTRVSWQGFITRKFHIIFLLTKPFTQLILATEVCWSNTFLGVGVQAKAGLNGKLNAGHQTERDCVGVCKITFEFE